MPPKRVAQPGELSTRIQQPHHLQPQPGDQQTDIPVDREYRAQNGLTAKKVKGQINKEAHHDELLNAVQNRPWHIVRRSQRRIAKDRARADKAEKERKKRQGRIDRDLSVPPSPIQSELDIRQAATQALSAKLKGRTKRSVLEHLIGSGGLHAWKEKTITNHAAQTMPTAYEWAWRQKEFRCEERMADRIDRMVGRIIGEHDAAHQEQLRLDREAYIDQQIRHMRGYDTGGNSRVASSGAVAKEALTKGPDSGIFNKKARASEPSYTLNICNSQNQDKKAQFMGGDVGNEEKIDARMSHGRGYSTSNAKHIDNSHKLASEIAAFIDENDDLGGLLRDISESLNESANTNEIYKYIKDRNHNNCADESNLKSPFDLRNSDGNNAMDNTIFQKYCDKLGGENFHVEYGEEKETVFEDIMAIEWLNNFLEKSINEVFLATARRFNPDEYISPEGLATLRDRVLNDIKQEWALALCLEDTAASKSNKTLDLEPFKKRFGQSFEEVLISAVSGDHSHVFAKTAKAAANLNAKEVNDDTMYIDGYDPDDDQSEEEDDPYSPDIWDSHEYVNNSPLSEDDEPIDSENDSTGWFSSAAIKEQRREVIQEALRRAADNILDSGRHSVLIDESKLRKLWGPDWRLQYTAAFNSAVRETLVQNGFYMNPEDVRNVPITTQHSFGRYQPRHPLRQQTDPRFWPRTEPGRDQFHIDAVNKKLAKDTYNLEKDAEENERNSNWAYANARDKGYISLNELMDFDQPPYFDLKKRTRDAPDEYRHEPKRHKPLKIDPQDSYVMGCFWPLADDGEAWSYSREEVDLEGREDAYDGRSIPFPKLSPRDPNDNKEKGIKVPQNNNQKRPPIIDLTQRRATRGKKLYSDQVKAKQASIKNQMGENERKAKILYEELKKKVKAGWRPKPQNIPDMIDPAPCIQDTFRFTGSKFGSLNGIANDGMTKNRSLEFTPLPLGQSDVTLGSKFDQDTNDTGAPSTVKTGLKASGPDTAGNIGRTPKVTNPEKSDYLKVPQQTRKRTPGTVPYPTLKPTASFTKSSGPPRGVDYDKLGKPNLPKIILDKSPMHTEQNSLSVLKSSPGISEQKNHQQSAQTITLDVPPHKHESFAVDNSSSPREGTASILNERGRETRQVQDLNRSVPEDKPVEQSTGPKISSLIPQDSSSGINRAPIIYPIMNNPNEKYRSDISENIPSAANVSAGNSPDNKAWSHIADTSGIAAIENVRRELEVLRLELQPHGNEKLRIVGSMTLENIAMLQARIGKLQDACLYTATDNSAKARRAQINLLKDIKSLEAWVAKLCEAVEGRAQAIGRFGGLS